MPPPRLDQVAQTLGVRAAHRPDRPDFGSASEPHRTHCQSPVAAVGPSGAAVAALGPDVHWRNAVIGLQGLAIGRPDFGWGPDCRSRFG